MTNQTCSCGQPTAGAWLCESCEKTFSYAVVHVGVYYADLLTVSTKQARFGSVGATKGSIGKAQPLPVDTRFVDAGSPPADDKSGRPRGATLAPGSQLRWDTWQTVTAWTKTVMEEAGPPLLEPACESCIHASCTNIRRRRYPGHTIGSMIRYLARQFRWILRQQWAPAMLDELLNLEHRLAYMVDRQPDKWYAGKCSATDGSGNTCTAELYAETDRGDIVCRACGERHDVASRRDLLLTEAKDIVVTATEAAGALMAWTDYDGSESKLVDRIRKWRDRERLTVADVTSLHGRDRHLYRLGDIQELMVADAQRHQKRNLGESA